MGATAALWVSIVLGGVAQILLKRGINGMGAVGSVRSPRWWIGLLGSGWIWAWAFSFTVATALWLLAISQLNISYAYPLLSASYVFVAVLSRLFLGEKIPWQRWTAIAVISLGVILIVRH